jgi:hypothetical protein
LLLAAFQSLGTLPTWILVIMAVIVAYRVTKGGAGSAVSELSKANEVLTRAVHEEREKREALGGEVRDLGKENALLKGRTDFASSLAAALGPLSEWTAGHEARAQERHEAQMAAATKNTEAVLLVLERIGERFGPDDEGRRHG